jgi:hypothetical protein
MQLCKFFQPRVSCRHNGTSWFSAKFFDITFIKVPSLSIYLSPTKQMKVKRWVCFKIEPVLRCNCISWEATKPIVDACSFQFTIKISLGA